MRRTPTSLQARTANEYVVLSARPARRIDVASPTPSTEPLTEIWYCVSALPLALAAGQLRSTPPTPDGLALIDPGPIGGPAGTTTFDAGLHGPHPTSFWARTSNE